jgi:hypothetical protein
MNLALNMRHILIDERQGRITASEKKVQNDEPPTIFLTVEGFWSTWDL